MYLSNISYRYSIIRKFLGYSVDIIKKIRIVIDKKY